MNDKRTFWSNLWNSRNEPSLVILSISLSLAIFVGVAICTWQFFVRQGTLDIGGIHIPAPAPDPIPAPDPNSTDVADRLIPTDFAGVPIGTILPFFGSDDQIPKNWVVCDGRNNPPGSKIIYDANKSEGGIQLPDLRGKFVRGSEGRLDENQITMGGVDSFSTEHSHLWAEFTGKVWNSYNESGGFGRVDDWNDGIGDSGKGNLPLSNDMSMKLYTEQKGEPIDNRPSHVELRFIIRIY